MERDARETIEWMKLLNDKDTREVLENGARAATSFSLLGHVWEMAVASGVRLRFNLCFISLYPHVEEMAVKWSFPGGGYDNAEYFGPHVRFTESIGKKTQLVLFDLQTPGGLLFVLSSDLAESCIDRAAEAGYQYGGLEKLPI